MNFVVIAISICCLTALAVSLDKDKIPQGRDDSLPKYRMVSNIKHRTPDSLYNPNQPCTILRTPKCLLHRLKVGGTIQV